MRIFLIFIIFIVGLILSALTVVYVTPYYVYDQVVNKNMKSQWYLLDRYSERYLKPSKKITYDIEKLPNESFWKKFHFGDLNIPLPVKNPFFFVVPNLSYNSTKQTTKLSISIIDADNEKISDIFFLPNMSFPSYLSTQPLFELPLVRKQILLKNNDEIWKDAFSKDITKWKIGLDEMAYNLYLLEFRSKMLNRDIHEFGFLDGEQFVSVNLNYANKDYKSELIMKKRGNKIYSFVIIGRKNHAGADVIRLKMIKDMDYIESTPTLADIIFQEFKSLKYEKQIDHEGMLFLLSAWSHDQARKAIFEKIIFYLERGFENRKQLEPLYTYYYARYKKIYSIKKIDDLELDTDILLQKKIDIEKREKRKKDEKVKPYIPVKNLSIDEQYEKILNDTKIKSKADTKIIRID